MTEGVKSSDIRLFSDITGKKVTKDDIANIYITSAAGKNVSFASISDISSERNVSAINRIDRQKNVTVHASLTSEDTSGVTARVSSYLEKNPLPSGVSSRSGGIVELIEDSIPPLVTALAIAWFLVYTVMVLQFERFRQPLIVMASIPFCLIGVILGLLLFGSTISILAFMGVVSLGGIVVNNGIILIDYINLLRQRKKKECPDMDEIQILEECTADGSASRIRPIFMTTLTTMIGVVPMALSKGEGAEIYAPLGQSIAGGLLTSTLITLFIIPVLYYLTEKHRIKKNRNANVRAANANVRSFPLIVFALCLAAHVLCLAPLDAQAAAAVPSAQTASTQAATADAKHTDSSFRNDDSASSALSADAVFTPEQLIFHALEHNSAVRKARESYAQSMLDVSNAKAGYGPTVELTAAFTYITNPMEIEIKADQLNYLTHGEPKQIGIDTWTMPGVNIPVYSWMPTGTTAALPLMENEQLLCRVVISQPVFTWGKITNAVKLYQKTAAVKKVQLDDLTLRTKTEIDSYLSSLHFINLILSELEKQKTYAARLVAITEDAEKNGTLLYQDVLDMKVKAREIDIAEKTTRAQYSNIITALEQITGIKNFSPKNIASYKRPAFPSSITNEERKIIEDAALSTSNYTVLSITLMQDTAAFAQKIAKADIYWKPDLALQASLGYSGNFPSSEDDCEKNYQTDFTIALKTTMWDGGKKLNEIKRAASRTEEAAAGFDEAKGSILRKVRETFSSIGTSSANISYQEVKIETSALAAAQADRIASSGYGSEHDVLKARIDESASRAAMYKWQAEHAASWYTLRYLAGKDAESIPSLCF